MRRQLGKWFAYFLLVMGLLVAGLYVARDPLRNALARLATTQLSSLLQGSVHIGRLRGTLLTSLVLRDVVVRDAEEDVLRIEEIRVTYTPLALLRGSITVTADLLRPQLTLRQAADGSLNLARLLPAKTSPSPPSSEPLTPDLGLPFAITLGHLHIHDGQMTLALPSLPGVKRVEGLTMHIQGQVNRQGLQVALRQLTAHAFPADVALQAVDGIFRWSDTGMQLTDVRLQTGQTLVTANGPLPGAAQTANVAVNLQPLDLTDIGQLLQNPRLQGLIQATLQVQGPPEGLQWHGEINTPSGQLTLQGEADIVASPLRYEGALALHHLDLAAMLASEPLRSDLNLHMQVRGSGWHPADMHGTVHVDIPASHLGRIRVQPSTLHIALEPQQIRIEQCQLETSVARLSATGALHFSERSSLAYDLQVALADLQDLLELPDLQGRIHLQGKAEGTLTDLAIQGTLMASQLHVKGNRVQAVQLTYEGTPRGAEPRFAGKFTVQQAQAGTVPIELFAGEATYQGSTRELLFPTLHIRLADHDWRAPQPVAIRLGEDGVQLTQVHLAHAQESLKLSGTLQGQHLQDLRLDVAQFDLTFLQRWLGLPDPVHGHVDAQVALTGTLAEPALQVDFAWQPAARPQRAFETVVFHLEYAARQVQSTIRVQQQNREVITGELTLPLDLALTARPPGDRLVEAPMVLRTTLKRPDLAALPYFHTAIPPLSGTLEGSLTLTGEYPALALETSGRLLQVSLPGILEQVSAPLRLSAEIVTAASFAELRQALNQANVELHLRNLHLQMPTLQGTLLSQGAPPRRLNVRDMVLQAQAQFRKGGIQATISRFDAQLSADGLPAATLQMAAQFTPQQLTLSSFAVRLPRSELHGSGQLTLPGQELKLHLELPKVRLDEVMSPWSATLPAELQGTIDVRGQVTAPEADIRLQYAGGQIRFTGTAQLPQERYQATLRLEGFDIARFLPGEQGRLRGQWDIQGSGFASAARQASTTLRLEAPTLTLAPNLDIRLQARLAGDTITLDTMRLQSVPLLLTAAGTASLSDQVNVSYSLKLGDLTPLQRRLQVPLQGRGSLQGTLQGTLQALRTQGKLQLTQWRYADWQGERVQAEWQGTRLLTEPEATLTVQVKDVQGPSLPASDVRLEGQYARQQGTLKVAVLDGPFQKTALEGRLAMGTPPQVTLSRLRLQRQNLLWENVGPIEALRAADGTLELRRLLLRSGKQEIRLQGKMAAQGALQAEVIVQRLQIAPTIQAVAPQAKVPDGQLDLELTLGGTVQRPQLHGTVHLQALEWQKQALGALQGRFGTEGTNLQMELRWYEQQQDLLTLDGTVGLAPPQALALRVQAANLDLQRLKKLSPEVLESAGKLHLDLRLQGTPQRPRLYGDVIVQNGLLHLKALGERYKNLQARVHVDGERVEIAQIQMDSRTGPLALQGWIETADLTLKQLAITVKSQEFTAIHSTDIEAVISAAIQVQGSLDAMEATGTIKVPRARVRLSGALAGEPEMVQPWQLTVNGVYGSGPPGKKPGVSSEILRPADPLPFLQANLRVDMPQNVWVQGPGTAVELSGDLRLTKERQEPFIVSGTVQTVRGFAKFYGKKFAVQNGTVTFTGSPEINPLLDVTATHQVSEYLINIHATGKARQPKIDLSSTPEASQGDILSLLVVGKTTDRLTTSEQNSLSSSFQRVLGNVAGSQLENLVGQELGLDTIEIEAGEKPGDARVSVGRYVTQDLFLSYEQQIGQKEGTAIGLEYSINRRLKLKGSGSSTGESALDILWRIEY